MYLRFSLLIFVLIFTFISCKKENNPQKNIVTDEIYYHDFDPDINISTIREYYTIINPNCPPLPLPNDSLVNFEFDLDNDSVNDFNIQIKHFEQQITQYCGHCGIFHIKMITIKPLNDSGMISLDTASTYWIRNYDTAEVITKNDLWKNTEVAALLMDGCLTPYISFSDTYFGLHVEEMIGWIHLSRSANNGLLIKEIAINKLKNNPIKPGQVK